MSTPAVSGRRLPPSDLNLGDFSGRMGLALLRLSGSAWLNRSTVLPLLAQIHREGIADTGDRTAAAEGHRRTRPGKQEVNLRFNAHTLSPTGNSPYVEPPKEIIVLLARITRARRLCLLWLRAWGAPVCVRMPLLPGGSTAERQRKAVPSEVIRVPLS